MKFKVTYHDVESKQVITRECQSFDYLTSDNEFTFTPINGRIFKSIAIKSPTVTVTYDRGVRGLYLIKVEGFQYIGEKGGYWPTKTTIELIDDTEQK